MQSQHLGARDGRSRPVWAPGKFQANLGYKMRSCLPELRSRSINGQVSVLHRPPSVWDSAAAPANRIAQASDSLWEPLSANSTFWDHEVHLTTEIFRKGSECRRLNHLSMPCSWWIFSALELPASLNGEWETVFQTLLASPTHPSPHSHPASHHHPPSSHSTLLPRPH